MDLDNIKRSLRAEIKKRENEQYATFQCNVRQMCKDVLDKLEEQEQEIAGLNVMLQETCIERDENVVVDELTEELYNQKYKRCLAMAKWCEFYADTLRVKRNQCRYDEAELAESYYIRCCRYRRWCKVWLELAEKFKELKNAED